MMKCPKCDGEIYVVSVIQDTYNRTTYRNRKCKACGSSFYTVEMALPSTANDDIDRLWTIYRKKMREKKKETSND